MMMHFIISHFVGRADIESSGYVYILPRARSKKRYRIKNEQQVLD
jgi:hypothetical protein